MQIASHSGVVSNRNGTGRLGANRSPDLGLGPGGDSAGVGGDAAADIRLVACRHGTGIGADAATDIRPIACCHGTGNRVGQRTQHNTLGADGDGTGNGLQAAVYLGLCTNGDSPCELAEKVAFNIIQGTHIDSTGQSRDATVHLAARPDGDHPGDRRGDRSVDGGSVSDIYGTRARRKVADHMVVVTYVDHNIQSFDVTGVFHIGTQGDHADAGQIGIPDKVGTNVGGSFDGQGQRNGLGFVDLAAIARRKCRGEIDGYWRCASQRDGVAGTERQSPAGVSATSPAAAARK